MISTYRATLFICILLSFYACLPLFAQTASSTKKTLEEMNKEIEDLKKRVDTLEKKSKENIGLKLSGFFDVYMSNYQNKPNIFEIGSLELFIEHNYKENFNVAAALVFNEGAELGVGFIDYHFYGGSISPRGRLYEQKGIHLQVGKFDVPFGNDWQYFSAIDRIQVTAPITTELIMEEGYNDVGIRVLSNFIAFNTTLYVLRGIEEGYSYGGNSLGGRIGFTPFNNPYLLRSKSMQTFECGFSYILDVDKSWGTAEQLYAIDAEAAVGPFTISTEYYNRDKAVGILMTGYHTTLGLKMKDITGWPVTMYARYGYYHFERYKKIDETNNLSRVTAGLNINMFNISYLKFEYIRFLKTYTEYIETDYYNDNLVFVQLIIAF